MFFKRLFFSEKTFTFALFRIILILGAFGCGAFANNPEVVAPAYKNVLENYKNAFETVEFAIYARNKEDRNFKTFNCVFEK